MPTWDRIAKKLWRKKEDILGEFSELEAATSIPRSFLRHSNFQGMESELMDSPRAYSTGTLAHLNPNSAVSKNMGVCFGWWYFPASSYAILLCNFVLHPVGHSWRKTLLLLLLSSSSAGWGLHLMADPLCYSWWHPRQLSSNLPLFCGMRVFECSSTRENWFSSVVVF